MTEFLQIALALPTVVYSAILLVLGLYWALVILGALDLDLFDFDFDVDMDVELDVDVDLDMDVDIDGDLAAPGVFAAAAGALGLGIVPVTVIFSFWILSAWLISFTSVHYLSPLLGGPGALSAVIFGLGSLAAALPVTMLIMRPFIKLFEQPEEAQGGAALIGEVCEVSTSRVDAGFGRATLADGGAGLILPVRCADTSNGLKRGSKALIIDFDPDQHAYIIEPYDAFLGGRVEPDAVTLDENIARAVNEFDENTRANSPQNAAEIQVAQEQKS